MTPERLAEIRQSGWLAWCQVVQVLDAAEAALAEADRLRAQVTKAYVDGYREGQDDAEAEIWTDNPHIPPSYRAALAGFKAQVQTLTSETPQQRRWRENREEVERRYRAALASGDQEQP